MTQRTKKAWTKWRRLVSEQGRSGQSVAAFCRERGVCAPQFFAWKKRLREAAGQPLRVGGGAARFVEVQLAASVPEVRAREARSWGRATVEVAIAVRLKNERSLLVGPGFDAQHLRALLAVVETAG